MSVNLTFGSIIIKWPIDHALLTEPYSERMICRRIWPSALIINQYLWEHRDGIRGKCVLDLGCGTGLSSVMAALCGASRVIMQDAPGNIDLTLFHEQLMSINNANNYERLELLWGDTVDLKKNVDIIISSDTFYEPISNVLYY